MLLALMFSAVPVWANPVLDDDPTPIEDRNQVSNGEQVDMGGTTVTFNVTAVSSMNTVGVTATSDSGTSPSKVSDPGKSSTGKNPTTSGTPSMTAGSGGPTVRVNPDTGNPEYLNGKGEWVQGKRIKKKTKKTGKEALGFTPMQNFPASSEDGVGTGPIVYSGDGASTRLKRSAVTL